MRTAITLCGLAAICAWAAVPARADGGFIFLEGDAAALAQTRQEVVIAFYRDGAGEAAVDNALYVLRSSYTGTPPQSFVWLVPVPATPTDVVAHQNGALFERLDDLTRPRFFIDTGTNQPAMCGCAANAPGDRDLAGGLVDVEAQGQAGIFDWAALTSTGADALLDWLNANSFAVPDAAAGVLQTYIDQELHFLAIRVAAPAELITDQNGEIAIPPIQFTCQTSRRFYPMVISQISAAEETEVLIYLLAEHRNQAANVPNVLIDEEALAADDDSPSLTNYEQLFTDAIATAGGLALVTEYAQHWYGETAWVTAPPAVLELKFLTRLRTVLTPDHMTRDFEFQDAPTDETVYSVFWIEGTEVAGVVAALGMPAALLLVYLGFHTTMKHRRSARRAR